MEQVIDFIAVWLPVALSAVGTFSLIAAITPTKSDDKIADWLFKTLHFLGANFGKAKNKE